MTVIVGLTVQLLREVLVMINKYLKTAQILPPPDYPDGDIWIG